MIIQTPGVSRFFGCTPLGPIGWGLAGGGATAGTVLGAVLLRGLPGDGAGSTDATSA